MCVVLVVKNVEILVWKNFVYRKQSYVYVYLYLYEAMMESERRLLCNCSVIVVNLQPLDCSGHREVAIRNWY